VSLCEASRHEVLKESGANVTKKAELSFPLTFRLKPPEPLGEEEEDARTETEQHHGNAGRNSPERSVRGATIFTPAHDDVTGNRDQ